MKILPEHLARGAFVYVRQSTADQLVNNPESRRGRRHRVDCGSQVEGSALEVNIVTYHAKLT